MKPVRAAAVVTATLAVLALAHRDEHPHPHPHEPPDRAVRECARFRESGNPVRSPNWCPVPAGR